MKMSFSAQDGSDHLYPSYQPNPAKIAPLSTTESAVHPMANWDHLVVWRRAQRALRVSGWPWWEVTGCVGSAGR